MEIKSKKEKSGTRILFSGNATIDSAAQAKDKLLAILDKSRHVIVDIGGLERVGIAFLQVLVAAEKSALAAGKSIQIDAECPSKVFTDAVLKSGFYHGRKKAVGDYSYPIISAYYTVVTQEGENG